MKRIPLKQVNQMIYADNAATTQLDTDAFEAMKPYLLNEFGNASQPYSFARKPKKALQEAREIIASCIGAASDEIFFTAGGSESDNWAIRGSALLNENKRATITSAFEHHAILRACEAIERQGYPVAYIFPTNEGYITPEKLSQVVTDNTFLVSVMLANNEIGTIQPIKELCKIAHEHGALFHTDAVQAVGHVPINVTELGFDMLSASAHKFNGPKGIGFLYIRKGTSIASYISGGSQERNMRAGTENVAGIVGMAAALKKNVDRMTETTAALKELEATFLTRLLLSGIDYIKNGGHNRLPGNVNISIRGADGEMLLHRLDLKGICISTGSACDSVNTQVSHVIESIKVPTEYANGTIRISFGVDNTKEEALTVAEALINILNH